MSPDRTWCAEMSHRRAMVESMFADSVNPGLSGFVRDMFQDEPIHRPVMLPTDLADKRGVIHDQRLGFVARVRLADKWRHAKDADWEATVAASALKDAQRRAERTFVRASFMCLALVAPLAMTMRCGVVPRPHEHVWIVLGIVSVVWWSLLLGFERLTAGRWKPWVRPTQQISVEATEKGYDLEVAVRIAVEGEEAKRRAHLRAMCRGWLTSRAATGQAPMPCPSEAPKNDADPPGRLVASSPHSTTGPPATHHRDALMGAGGVLAA